MKEQEKILSHLLRALNSKKLAEAIEKMNMAINLFGKPTSADKHYFLRIAKADDKLVLWGREEHLPKKDAKGNWILFSYEDIDMDQDIQPTIELIPTELTSDDFLSYFEKNLQEEYEEGCQLTYQEIREIMAEIKNEN